VKELDLDRVRIPGQVADQVLEDLKQLDADRRDLGLGPLSNPVHHLVNRRATLSARLEQHRHVAGVGRRGEKPELAAGPPGEGLHVGIGLENLLDAAHHRVGFRERAAGRRPVVEDEAALVHVGHETGADAPAEEEERGGEDERDHAGKRRAPQQRTEHAGVHPLYRRQ